MTLKKILLLFFLLIILLNKCFTQNSINYYFNLSKVWGVVKYFHPNIQTGTINWDSILIKTLPKIENINNDVEFNILIKEFIKSAGVSKNIRQNSKYFPKDTTYNNLDFNWIKNNKIIDQENKNTLLQIINNYIPHSNVYIKYEIIDCYKNSDLTTTESVDKWQALLSLYRYWNVIEYFYPHKKTNNLNWDDVLMEFIPKIIDASGKNDIYNVLIELVGKINDCHSGYVTSNYKYDLYPINLKYIEGKTIVYDILDTLSKSVNLNKGDIIKSINNVNIDTIRIQKRYLCGCPDDYIANNRINYMLLNEPDKDTLSLEVEKIDGSLKKIILIKKKNLLALSEYTNRYFDNKKKGNSNITVVNYPNDITYINIENINSYNIKKIFENAIKSRGIILDFRCYPKVWPSEITSFFSNKKLPINIFYTINYDYPGAFDYAFKKSPKRLFNFDQTFNGKLVILANDETQSAAEWDIMWLQALYNPIIVGSKTAGANGGIVPILIQKNFYSFFTGTVVLYPDGRPIQRTGIIPDIEIKPTIEGIRNNKDEILLKAIEILNSNDN